MSGTDVVFGLIVTVSLWVLMRKIWRLFQDESPCCHCPDQNCPASRSSKISQKFFYLFTAKENQQN
ncbi:hypothetical protein [Thermosulfurimonas sp. F29]|uniref:hypothetical protein n=1 Tax=Thermosulfurimonas sp. F29 TaxID=2867247 RepID=UPI001C83173B|nr:hypothetical protein [Thermosulfurimonas sp. F29]MBX6422227.1 hypothetical protein [Thermosulfurimonas sp. F29]